MTSQGVEEYGGSPAGTETVRVTLPLTICTYDLLLILMQRHPLNKVDTWHSMIKLN